MPLFLRFCAPNSQNFNFDIAAQEQMAGLECRMRILAAETSVWVILTLVFVFQAGRTQPKTAQTDVRATAQQ